MHNIPVSDEIYHSLSELASERGQTLEQLLTDLLAEERWEEHATRAYDAYHAHEPESHEVLTEDEFFAALRDQPTGTSRGDPDADL